MLCITFDNFGWAAGEALPWLCPSDVPADEWANYNRIGLEVGHPRLLKLLHDLDIRCTYFAEGYAAILHPEEMKRWHRAGHEIAVHGWKHEMWSGIASREEENSLVQLAVESLHTLLGEAPVGFRPPGLAINSWTDDVLAANGIRYVSQSLPAAGVSGGRGASSPGERPHVVTRLDLLPTDPSLIDGAVIHPRFGGVFGALDAVGAYERLYDMAVEHESTCPAEPWVLVVHPFTSGNRAWSGFEYFMRRLANEFGASRFYRARDAASKKVRAIRDLP
ncbi:polysaccharide deacetylase family protein [Paraburkholderia sp.]|uniref:polysaccharide deacetylase family protein n=1 Tax=Paraburkholderia sp. TaxID=1926495 RepID=UPI003C7A7543